MNNPCLPISIAMLPSVMADIELQSYTHSSTGHKATPDKLLKIVTTHLDSGICQFIYRKKDGVYRKATGTRKAEFIPITKTSATTAAPVEGKTNYFDFGSKEFRSFSNDSVVAVLVW